MNKTISDTEVYSSADKKEIIADLTGGTYVQTRTYDVATGMWKINFYAEDEIHDGYVSAADLTIAITSVVLGDGTVENVPEKLKNQPEGIAAYLNERYSDRTFVVEDGIISSVSGKTPLAEDVKTEPVEDAQTEESEPDTEPVEDAQTEESEPDTEPAEDAQTEESEPEITPESAPSATPRSTVKAVVNATPEAIATPEPEKTEAPVTPLPADQLPVPEVLKNVLIIGTNECLVEENGEKKLVKTSAIGFSESTKKNKQIAYIRPSTEGCAYFYAEANPRSRLLGYVKSGALVCVIKSGSNYARIYVDGIVGFVKNNMLNYMTVDKKPAGKGVLTIGGVVSEDAQVNLLSSTTKSFTQANLPCGLEVVIWQQKGKFYEVEANGYHGWVAAANLTKSGTESTVEQSAMEYIIQEMPVLTKTVRNNNGTETVWDNTKTYNMHRDPYN